MGGPRKVDVNHLGKVQRLSLAVTEYTECSGCFLAVRRQFETGPEKQAKPMGMPKGRTQKKAGDGT
jgi:hypothetical protein